MTFLSPIYLWGLLSLIPLVAVYLLKVRPVRHTTNAWFLWQKVFEEKQNSSLFSKMRHFLSLLLMCLAVCAVIFSLAQPRFGNTDQSDLIIVIDSSASMASKSNGQSRLDAAKNDAHKLIRGMHGDQQAMVISIDNQLNFLTHLSRNSHELHKAVDSIKESTLPLSKNALEKLSHTTNLSDSNAVQNRVLLLTDGCSEITQEALQGLEHLIYFEDSNNVGIVSADIQRIPGKNRDARCMVRLGSSSDTPVDIELEIVHSKTGAIGKLTKVRIQPGLNKPKVFTIPQSSEGSWIVRLLTEDALEADNTAYLNIQEKASVPVATSVEDSYFYQNCIEAFEQSGGTLRYSNSPSSSLLTLAHQSVPSNAQNHTLVFAPRGESKFWSEVGDPLVVGVAIAEDENHPALRHLDLNQMPFHGAVRLKAPSKAKILVSSDDGTPLIYQVHEGSQSIVVVNLDPAEYDFFLSPWFPVVVYDTATYLSGTDTQTLSSYPTGHQLIGSKTDRSRIHTPSGISHTLDAGESIMLDEMGDYKIDTPKRNYTVSASLFSLSESVQSNNIESQQDEAVVVHASPSFWLIVLALIVILVESILYHRRKVG